MLICPKGRGGQGPPRLPGRQRLEGAVSQATMPRAPSSPTVRAPKSTQTPQSRGKADPHHVLSPPGTPHAQSHPAGDHAPSPS